MNLLSFLVKKITLDLFLIIFIYITIFLNSYVFFKYPFEFYLGYIAYIILLPILLIRFGINKGILNIFSILLITGIINIILNNNTFSLFIKVFTGLFLAYIFYDAIIKQFNFNINLLFKWYLYGAVIVSIIGLFQFISYQIGFYNGYDFRWILNKWSFAPGGIFGIRINSILAEPTYLATTLAPAFFVSIFNLTRKKSIFIGKTGSIIISVVFILSFSALGQMGIFLTISFLLVNFGLVRYFIFFLVIGIITFNVLYNNVKDFRDRYESIIILYTYGPSSFKLGETHGSSFILYNNSIVTKENLKSNFIFGTGIGSHPIAFEKYNISNSIKTAGFDNNSSDASSMLLRLLSETGLFGTILFLYIVIRFYIKRDPEVNTTHWLISNAILIMILLNLFRQGHYFLNGFPFFVLLYYYNYIDFKNQNNLQASE